MMQARTHTTMMTQTFHPKLDRLPAEILLEVATYLSPRTDILQLSRVSSVIYAKVIPALYADVELHGVEQCERTLGMLERCPDVARHTQRLAVFPEDEPTRPRDRVRAWDNAGIVSRCVLKAARYLDALARFDWEGEDMLPDDRMWAELRSKCPRLRHIGTTLGCFLPRPTSSLLQFSGLTGFSLSLKDGFYAHSLHLPSRESEPVFTRLWDMLTLRCPDLQSLRVVGNSTEPSDAARLYTASWPNLRHLAFGSIVWDAETPGHAQAVRDFVEFLERHPTLESLHLLGRPTATQIDLSTLSPEALPNLKEFSGSFGLLRTLVERSHPLDGAPAPIPVNPNQQLPPIVHTSLSKTLQRICFPHAMHLRDLTPLVISRVLQGLRSLKSVKVTFAIQGGYDSNEIFRTIVASCPHILDLDITCTNRPSFFLDAFANSLRGLSRLRTLSLSLVRMAGEEPMHVGAARIALANPRLKSFCIAFIPPHTSGADGCPPAPFEHGAFELVSDPHGIPVCLHVHQRAAPRWPWQRHPGACSGAAIAEWCAAVAGALGVEAPLMLLENGVGVASRFALGLGSGLDFASSLWLGLGGLGNGIGMGWGLKLGRPRASVRRWVCDLRPSGHPDVAQKGVGELLVERSPAGEEARLLVFCLCLLLLTLWALASKAER
ncbi:hypothetical protein GSI_01779 [Ganoderma sinense ZZ0214-1]|uniref:F-box domain-containing protein n=1 Tax=Ganoderma sinense ZZ0214-1 TaxID=1077348 RepID=A0A2G8SQS6_9APHY|nr:hypothetical protein GSI_01779 [Ganoderma sinense ZZ0214-1]